VDFAKSHRLRYLFQNQIAPAKGTGQGVEPGVFAIPGQGSGNRRRDGVGLPAGCVGCAPGGLVIRAGQVEAHLKALRRTGQFELDVQVEIHFIGAAAGPAVQTADMDRRQGKQQHGTDQAAGLGRVELAGKAFQADQQLRRRTGRDQAGDVARPGGEAAPVTAGFAAVDPDGRLEHGAFKAQKDLLALEIRRDVDRPPERHMTRGRFQPECVEVVGDVDRLPVPVGGVKPVAVFGTRSPVPGAGKVDDRLPNPGDPIGQRRECRHVPGCHVLDQSICLLTSDRRDRRACRILPGRAA